MTKIEVVTGKGKNGLESLTPCPYPQKNRHKDDSVKVGSLMCNLCKHKNSEYKFPTGTVIFCSGDENL